MRGGSCRAGREGRPFFMGLGNTMGGVGVGVGLGASVIPTHGGLYSGVERRTCGIP